MNRFIFYILLVLIFIATNILDDKIRTFTQTNKTLYEVIMASDLYVFAINGGGTFGYNNYYKWAYAKWRSDPKRTILEKIMFWKAGFFYDASNPPDKYQYPLL